MYNYLKDYTVKNVWCIPDQDRQFIVKMYRLTPPPGEKNRFKLINNWISFPTLNTIYHAFRIGGLHPSFFNLIADQQDWLIQGWKEFTPNYPDKKNIVYLYTDKGVIIPLHSVKYLFNHANDIIVAIREDSQLKVDYENDSFFIRVYTDAYFKSVESDALVDSVDITSTYVENNIDIVYQQTLYNEYLTKNGFTLTFANGYLINGVNLTTVFPKTHLTFYHDSSIKEIHQIDFSTIQTFISELDKSSKYLIHLPKRDNFDIDYHDDIEFFICQKLSYGNYRGVYYHKNMKYACRNVTHRDYSLLADNVQRHIDHLNAIAGRELTVDELMIIVVVRKSGATRFFGNEINRVKELYHLSDEVIYNTLLGIDSNVQAWTASHLEASTYMTLISAPSTELTMENIQEGYGYNGISTITASTPQIAETMGNLKGVRLPYLLSFNTTHYSYDVDGYLIKKDYQPVGTEYTTNDLSVNLIESIYGEGAITLDEVYGKNNLPIPVGYNYRVYYCEDPHGGIDETWEDITGDTYKYRIENDTLIVNTDTEINGLLMIRSDRKFLAYSFDGYYVDDILTFPLEQIQDRGDGLLPYTLAVPLYDLDIIMNGYSLIEGIDYFVNFPQVTIISKEHSHNFGPSSTEQLMIRMHGLCHHDLTYHKHGDYGFIQHGVLSNNNCYDLREDRVFRLVVNGQTKHRSQVEFSEFHQGISIVNSENGKPYVLKDIITPMKSLVDKDTYQYRDESLAIADTIADYLTKTIPQPPRDGLSAIPRRYVVYSPFIAKILSDLSQNYINSAMLAGTLTKQKVLAVCKPYEHLLLMDPIGLQTRLDQNYVVVHPTTRITPTPLSRLKYQFLLQVVVIYADNLIDLSPFITVQ